MKLIDDLARVGHRHQGRGHHPLRQPAGRPDLQEQARAAGHPRLHAPLHQGLPDRRRHHRQRRGLRRERLHRDRAPLVVVTGPGPGSGKLATCLSQLYHEYRRGLASGYAKFETFPIWNLPLKHPVNVAYEAATADICDFNLIDPFHLEAYGKVAVNYNRDVEVFPVLKRILEKITGGPSFYKSPTDMGCNAAGFGIADDGVVREAAKQELIRRFFRYSCEYTMGFVEKETVERAELLMKELGVKPEDRPVVGAARRAAEEAQATGKGNEGVLRRRGHGAPRRLHRHGQELPPHARRRGPRPQRGQEAGRDPGQDPPPLAVDHRVRRARSRRASSGPSPSASTCPRSSSA